MYALINAWNHLRYITFDYTIIKARNFWHIARL